MATRKKDTTGKEKKPKLSPIPCKGCDTMFVPKSRRQHYHSEQCREDYYARTFYAKKETRKMCPNCGEEFVTTKPGRQDYCTGACRNEARKKKRDGLRLRAEDRIKQFRTDRYKQMSADGFKCVLCGRMVKDGIKLDIVLDPKGSGRMTVCNECKEGMSNAEASA